MSLPTFTKRFTNQPILLLVAILIFIAVWFAPEFMKGIKIHGYAPWHTMLESFAVAVAAAVFAVVWHANVTPQAYARLRSVAAAFLAVAILDVAHLLSYNGMPEWFTPSGVGKGIYFWFFARYTAAFAVLLLVLPNKNIANAKKFAAHPLLIALAFSFISCWVVLAHQDWLPVFFVPGQGLTFVKIAMEWGLVLLMAFSLWLGQTRRQPDQIHDTASLSTAIIFTILSELCFMLYSNATDMFNVLGHIYKIFAYGFIYKSIVTAALQHPYQKLAENQKVLQQLTDNIQEVFWMTSPDKRQMYFISPGYEKIWGRSCQSLYERPISWLEAIHPEDLDRIMQSAQTQSNNNYQEEYRIIHTDGSVRWILDRAFPIADENGQIVRIAGLAADITHRKLLEQHIIDSERNLRTLIDNLPSLIAYWDKNLINVFANSPYASWFGQTPEELKGTHISAMMGNELFNKNLPYINHVINGTPQQFERILISPDGNRRDTLANYIPDFRDGMVKGFYVLVTDITASKQTEHKLRESEELLKSIVNVMAVGIVMQNKDDKILASNPAAEQILGLTKSQLYGLSSFDPRWRAIHENGTPFKPEDHPSVVTLRTGKPQQNVIMGVHKPDNSLSWISINSQPVVSLNTKEVASVVVSFHDITERRQAEAEREALRTQLTQAQKMESIGHLTGGIAHDFNNMLGAMLGYSELLKQVCTNAAGVPEQTSRYLNEILTAGHRAKELISQMLIFSRLGPEMQGQNSPVILLQPVIKEVVNMLRSSIPSNIQVNYHFPEETLRAQIQPVQLHQIILNLAINARDAINDYGEITISLSPSHARGRCDSCHQAFEGNYLTISVRDTGRGIPPEHLPKVFDPFFTTKDIGKGTGMGLSVVHGIVHSAGGHIEIHSSLQQGTEIRVLLPLVATPLTEATVTPITNVTSQGNLSGLRIMVVDDEHAMATMLAELLQLNGAQVRMFTRPEEALTTFENQPQAIDCLITDETMPQMTGLDLAKTVLQRRPELPIILLTGFSERVNENIAKQHGITGFMYKPLDILKLLILIQRIAVKG